MRNLWSFRVAIMVAAVMAGRTGLAQRPVERAAVIHVRPGTPTEACVPGVHPLGLARDRDGQFFVPPGSASKKLLPLVVFLHGAGRNAGEGLAALQSEAENGGFLLLAPESRDSTWDAIHGAQFGPDVEFLNRALTRVFAQCPVDRRHITLAGFSDGASYALSLGIANGGFFSNIIAFSPGFIVPAGRQGSPGIFIAHGQQDRILPIEVSSRRIVPELRALGYSVTYREFDGPHAMSRKIIAEAVRRLH